MTTVFDWAAAPGNWTWLGPEIAEELKRVAAPRVNCEKHGVYFGPDGCCGHCLEEAKAAFVVSRACCRCGVPMGRTEMCDRWDCDQLRK